MAPRTRYTTSQGLSIAYQVFGEGRLQVVNIDGFVSHQDMEWEVPHFRSMRERLGELGRVVTFDKRGAGCSDRDLGYGAPEDRMDDIRAVMDACDMEQADIIGSSEGGALAALFAATYPERVRRLVLYASVPFGGVDVEYPWGMDDEAKADALESVEKYWGTGAVIMHLMNASTDRELYSRYERATVTPRMAREIMAINMAIDVREALPAISAPTLIIHHEKDPTAPIEIAHWVATKVPESELLEIPDNGDSTHLSDDPIVWNRIHQFLLGEDRVLPVERVLTTILFTDIVSSTEIASRLGDAEWRRVLEAHDTIVDRCVERHRGRVVKSTGDGTFAVFDGPARGVRAAADMIEEIGPLGIEIRAGLHTGECEVRGDDFAGITVHIGARVSGLAKAGEIKVTSTVRDLVMGSGLEFIDAGAHELKGVPGSWQILDVV